MKENQIFNIGDIVRLKSGGPDMTIKEVGKHHSTGEFVGRYTCQWFAGKKLDDGTFPQPSLELVKAVNEP